MSLDSPPDTQAFDVLIAQYAQGDIRAARVLTQQLSPRCYALAFRMLADAAEAEDIVQEAMMRLWKTAPNWQPGQAKVSTWLHRVVSNLCIDRLRQRKTDGPGLDQVADPEDPAPGAEAGLLDSARRAALAQALSRLPDRQRIALSLRHFDGASNAEIAAQLEISIEAVESLTARAKRALAAALKGQKAALGYDTE